MLHTSLSLDYVMRPSNIEESAPLLIMLHGYGSDENDLFSFANELPEELLIVSARAPYSMQPFGNAWYAINFDAEKGKWNDNVQAKQSVDLISRFIDEIVAKYDAEKDNVTLLGFSQGTILSYAVALTYPQKAKNIVALSGYINQDILPEDLNKEDYSHLDFYCSHGSLDQVIPPDWARQTQPFLNTLQIKNVYSEFPVGHGVAPQNFYEFKEWLQKRI
ncbi:alpha/beta fold hydrolase [Hyunsoonleella flava]|uniref:Alpha/beta fold hydrolase n=1 Tax=Hyunsoonleella flava TaxID=2527939 RepID=A0A4Q9FJM0_9FLAO|nr:alpha/beta hydrolase-fold protein [Hyunsoonleella flava]TBN04366.1 alpha/beta fold hydrolase [Hyunsoonleella flava]